MTETITRMFDVIEQAFALTIDRRSMTATRFVTHLRYLFTRVTSGKQIAESHNSLVDAIANATPTRWSAQPNCNTSSRWASPRT